MGVFEVILILRIFEFRKFQKFTGQKLFAGKKTDKQNFAPIKRSFNKWLFHCLEASSFSGVLIISEHL